MGLINFQRDDVIFQAQFQNSRMARYHLRNVIGEKANFLGKKIDFRFDAIFKANREKPRYSHNFGQPMIRKPLSLKNESIKPVFFGFFTLVNSEAIRETNLGSKLCFFTKMLESLG